MQLFADNIGKKFNKEWIFRNLSFSLSAGESLAITGANGSGKSTLLQILAGSLPPTEGQIRYRQNDLAVPDEDFYTKIAFSAPYMELIEEMTVSELVRFHQGFKPLLNGLTTEKLLDKIWLTAAADRPVRFLSSGMKQRLKLGLSLFSDTPILMLDEPTTNLDNTGSEWYLEEVQKQLSERIVIICSNLPQEYSFCKQVLAIRPR
jgi:ABC-type multidrug transport system ATPase subunit